MNDIRVQWLPATRRTEPRVRSFPVCRRVRRRKSTVDDYRAALPILVAGSGDIEASSRATYRFDAAVEKPATRCGRLRPRLHRYCGVVANTVLIASVTGIVVSGVVGPAATAWAGRRAARKQFLRDQAAKRRDDLRDLFDQAATVLGVGPIRLRETREAQYSGTELTDEQRAWPEQVYVIGQRLQLRLGGDHAVVRQYDAVRKALRDAGQVAPDADRQRHENEVLRFETARDDFLAAAQEKLDEPIPDKEPR